MAGQIKENSPDIVKYPLGVEGKVDHGQDHCRDNETRIFCSLSLPPDPTHLPSYLVRSLFQVTS